MSRHERWESRDRTYSNWHRYACSDASTMIDVDGLDYCQRCRMPLLLVEAARDCGQEKPTFALQQLATSANVMAVCVLWTPSDTWAALPPHCECQRQRRRQDECDHGVASFRARRIHPNPSGWMPWTAAECATWIDRIHQSHERDQCQFAFGAA